MAAESICVLKPERYSIIPVLDCGIEELVVMWWVLWPGCFLSPSSSPFTEMGNTQDPINGYFKVLKDNGCEDERMDGEMSRQSPSPRLRRDCALPPMNARGSHTPLDCKLGFCGVKSFL